MICNKYLYYEAGNGAGSNKKCYGGEEKIVSLIQSLGLKTRNWTYFTLGVMTLCEIIP
jgi:hypothetical protein